MRQRKEYYPNLLEIKILLTVNYLNSLNLYPNQEGVFKILKGVVDNETKPLVNCPTFSVIVSIPKKKISLRINMLTRYEFLANKYSVNDNMMVLEVSKKGQTFLSEYSKKHKLDFTKKQKKESKTIIKL